MRTSEVLGDATHRVTYRGPRDAWGETAPRVLFIRVTAQSVRVLGSSAPEVLAAARVRELGHGLTPAAAAAAILSVEETVSFDDNLRAFDALAGPVRLAPEGPVPPGPVL